VEQPFILMSRAPAVHARALHSPGDLPEWNCGSCVWGEVLCEVGQRQTPEVWRLECFLDHEQTDKVHVCDLRKSEWGEYWQVAHGSAHDRAARLVTKLATYREVPPP